MTGSVGSSMGTDTLHERICAPTRYKLDARMPHPEGLKVCRRLPGDSDTAPVLLLTGDDMVLDRIAGLTAGADDSLGGPFAVQELIVRPHALQGSSRAVRRVPRLLHDVGDSGCALREDR